ncbi:MAG TPA: Holliday junction resolvase RuvX [Phycisphaerae bacterium]|nr:Holliday junction resolvase RuvX [Phycisphaerae bacterium]HOB73905.1 Holliday junction resolvase RuvX [Phycisphaerae bacterium]HOJ56166.1 Holliday junction resolvase RuvX [Phycisphaerae bacterium]HOL28111.1 Holliday junction resolvase RuvX [Phycisphaerae bacterium]HPP19778.1 Holliday junction resolvase RuvX [Phycisphaerae bacterium]
MSKRYLGVDLGTRRIGLAVGDSEGGVVTPVDVLDARPTPEANARAILEAADEYGVDGIVIGLPLNMDGTEGPQAKLSRSLAKAIQEIVSPTSPQAGKAGTLPASEGEQDDRPPDNVISSPPRSGKSAIKVFLQDERLSSFAADGKLVGRDLTRKKKKARQDALAAAVLLQAFLERHRK